MTTKSGNLGIDYNIGNTIQTNKGTQVAPAPKPLPRKCTKCDNTVAVNEEQCTQCFTALNEDTTRTILLD
jgi:hypothetical protein